MAGTQVAARAIRNHTRRQVERGKNVLRATILGGSPMRVTLDVSGFELEEGTDFELSAWMAAVRESAAFVKGEGVLLYKDDDAYIVFDLITDREITIGSGGGPAPAPLAVAANQVARSHPYGSRLGVPLIYDSNYYWWFMPFPDDFVDQWEEGRSAGWTLIDHLNSGYKTMLVPPPGEKGWYEFGVNGYIDCFATSYSGDWRVQGPILPALNQKALEMNIEASLILFGQFDDPGSTPDRWQGTDVGWYSEFDYPCSMAWMKRIAEAVEVQGSVAVNRVGETDPFGTPGKDISDFAFGFAVRDGDAGYKAPTSEPNGVPEYFSSYLYSGQTFDVSGGPAILPMSGFARDPAASFDITNGFAAAPNAYGLYHYTAAVTVTGMTAGDRFWLQIFDQYGSPQGRRSRFVAPGSDPFTVELSTLLSNFGAGHNLRIARDDGGTSITVAGQDSFSDAGTPTTFEGFLSNDVGGGPDYYGVPGTPLAAMYGPAFTATYLDFWAHKIGDRPPEGG